MRRGTQGEWEGVDKGLDACFDDTYSFGVGVGEEVIWCWDSALARLIRRKALN